MNVLCSCPTHLDNPEQLCPMCRSGFLDFLDSVASNTRESTSAQIDDNRSIWDLKNFCDYELVPRVEANLRELRPVFLPLAIAGVLALALFTEGPISNRRNSLPLISDKKIVIVAVIDTGVDHTIPEINRHLMRDDSGAIVSYDCTLRRFGRVHDFNGHGTHITGIITQLANRRSSEPDLVKILPMRVEFENQGSPAIAHCIDVAVKLNAKLINLSISGAGWRNDEYAALLRGQSAGVVAVSAAGNNGSDNDDFMRASYPASYGLENIISVASYDTDGQLSRSSNFGETSVDLIAPGQRVISYAPGGEMVPMSGTSQSAAMVTGLIASMLATNENLNPTTAKLSLFAQAEFRKTNTRVRRGVIKPRLFASTEWRELRAPAAALSSGP